MKPMLPMEKYFGQFELVHAFYGAMPTGDRRIQDMNLSQYVQYWGGKGASDGMITGAKGNT